MIGYICNVNTDVKCLQLQKKLNCQILPPFSQEFLWLRL